MIGSQNQDFRVIPGLWPELRNTYALDLGCGIGLYTQELERRGARAIGLDIQMSNLLEAKRMAGARKVFWVRGDGARLPFREGIFELIVSVEVLTHLPPEQRRAALREACRVVRQGGWVTITLHNRLRLNFARWLRLRRSLEVYETSHLEVWPTIPSQAGQLAAECGLSLGEEAQYLNYHSRFSHRFYHRHPHGSALVIWAEELLSRIPLVRRLSITFLLLLRKNLQNQCC